jgi:hypothetical protein
MLSNYRDEVYTLYAEQLTVKRITSLLLSLSAPAVWSQSEEKHAETPQVICTNNTNNDDEEDKDNGYNESAFSMITIRIYFTVISQSDNHV